MKSKKNYWLTVCILAAIWITGFLAVLLFNPWTNDGWNALKWLFVIALMPFFMLFLSAILNVFMQCMRLILQKILTTTISVFFVVISPIILGESGMLIEPILLIVMVSTTLTMVVLNVAQCELLHYLYCKNNKKEV